MKNSFRQAVMTGFAAPHPNQKKKVGFGGPKIGFTAPVSSTGSGYSDPNFEIDFSTLPCPKLQQLLSDIDYMLMAGHYSSSDAYGYYQLKRNQVQVALNNCTKSAVSPTPIDTPPTMTTTMPPSTDPGLPPVIPQSPPDTTISTPGPVSINVNSAGGLPNVINSVVPTGSGSFPSTDTGGGGGAGGGGDTTAPAKKKFNWWLLITIAALGFVGYQTYKQKGNMVSLAG